MSTEQADFGEMIAAIPRLTVNSKPRFHYCEPRWSWDPQPFVDWDLWLVLSGVGHITINNQPYPIQARDCFLFRPGDHASARHDPEQRLVVFAVHFSLNSRTASSLLPTHMSLVDTTDIVTLARRMTTYDVQTTDSSDYQTRLCLAQIILYLCEHLLGPEHEPVDERILPLLHAIRQEPGREWTVSEMASRTGLSRSQITRLFLASAGLAPLRYVIRCRVERATQLLRETDMRIGEIATALGYRDYHYFCRQFAAEAGRTPLQVRRSKAV